MTDTHTCSDRQTHTHAVTDRHTHTHAVTDRHTHMQWQTDTHTCSDRQTHTHAVTDRHTHMQWQTDRHTCSDRQTHTHAVTDRHTHCRCMKTQHTHMHTHMYTHSTHTTHTCSDLQSYERTRISHSHTHTTHADIMNGTNITREKSCHKSCNIFYSFSFILGPRKSAQTPLLSKIRVMEKMMIMAVTRTMTRKNSKEVCVVCCVLWIDFLRECCSQIYLIYF
jgi:hypothetical protein